MTGASFFFCEFMDLDFVSVHKYAKKELDQYPAILTSHLVNNPYQVRGNQIVEHSSDNGTVLGSSRELARAAEH